MPTPFQFTACDKLPPALAARMQTVADHRAALGLTNADGTTHRTAAAAEVYGTGGSPHSAAYLAAAFDNQTA